ARLQRGGLRHHGRRGPAHPRHAGLSRSRIREERPARRAPPRRKAGVAMYPRLLTIPAFDLLGKNIGPLTLHTYGVLLAIAFLTGLWVASRQATGARLDPARGTA